MNTLIAKPIVKNQYWVVTDGKEKVGNVVATGSGFELKMHGSTSYFDSTSTIQKHINIEFMPAAPKVAKALSFASFPLPAKHYNSILDVKRKLHLFTKSPKSKCYFAAGWYSVKQGATFEPMYCPKYIVIQRYEYSGPYSTEHDAQCT